MQTLLVDKMFQNQFQSFASMSISLREYTLLCDTEGGSLYFSLSKWLLLY